MAPPRHHLHHEVIRSAVALTAVLGLCVLSWGCNFRRNALPDEPIAFGGSGHGYESGIQYVTVHGGRSISTSSDPELSVAHIEISPDPSLEASLTDSSGGNTPDRFVFTGRESFKSRGTSFHVDLRVDGRQHAFSAGGRTFALADGNFFRIRIGPDRSIQASQLPVFDVLEGDHEKVKAVFRAHPPAEHR